MLVAEAGNGCLAGFAEVSIRQDYVEGSSTSPVPFLEGWFVNGLHRHFGVARSLLNASESWAHQQGFTEFASNAVLANDTAIATHLACGFREIERTAHFIKPLGNAC